MTHHDPVNLEFVKEYCLNNLSKYGILSLYFFGSRFNGLPRHNSDHDFYLIINDIKAHDIITGSAGHMKIFMDLDSKRRKDGLGAIDLLISGNSYFLQESVKSGTIAHAAKSGMQLI